MYQVTAKFSLNSISVFVFDHWGLLTINSMPMRQQEAELTIGLVSSNDQPVFDAENVKKKSIIAE